MKLSIKPKEYYMWRWGGYSGATYPWQREFLNPEFLSYERKRIEEVDRWYKKFRKAEIGAYLESVSLYTIPVELSKPLRAAIPKLESGNMKYDYIGLSALFNTPQFPIVGLLDKGIKRPTEYRLIEIKKGKRTNIVKERTKEVIEALIIEDYEYLKHDQIYIDVPYERRVVEKILKETLIGEERAAISLQAPVISSPYLSGSVGGISLASLSADSSFAREFVKTMALMVPPEYRQSLYPKLAYRGKKIRTRTGSFHVAERPCSSGNKFSSLSTREYREIKKELAERCRFTGEYSILSTLNPNKGRIKKTWKELLLNFHATEVTLPEPLDEFPESDADLKSLKKEINEDLWIQIVHSRQFYPAVNEKSERKIESLLEEDLDVLLEYQEGEDKEYLISSILPSFSYNVKRIAYSLARTDEKDRMKKSYLKRARKLLIDNFQLFLEHPEIENIKTAMKGSRGGARFNVVQTVLMNNPKSTESEIYNELRQGGLFNDKYDLRKLLNWLHERGYVVRGPHGRYIWV